MPTPEKATPPTPVLMGFGQRGSGQAQLYSERVAAKAYKKWGLAALLLVSGRP